jgi:hypothetical protein
VKIPPAHSPEPVCLVRRYEQLRERAVAETSPSATMDTLGLIVLIRHGMAAWMRGSDPPPAPPVCASRPATESRLDSPANPWRQEATILLANMALRFAPGAKLRAS